MNLISVSSSGHVFPLNFKMIFGVKASDLASGIYVYDAGYDEDGREVYINRASWDNLRKTTYQLPMPEFGV